MEFGKRRAVISAWIVGALTVSVAIGSCRSAGTFRHDAHLAVVKDECAPCHGKAAEAPRAAAREDCFPCHPEARDLKPGPGPKYGETVGVATTPPPPGYRDVIFSHAPHAKDGAGCAVCHAGRFFSGKPDLPSMTQCVACHERRGIRRQCADCHRKTVKTAIPASHDADWDIRHGKVSGAEKERCAYCHEDRSCSDCHATRRPRSHVGGWDKSAHGAQAVDDRTPCTVCHEAAFCSRCHAVPPPSHAVPNFTLSGHRAAARFNPRSCAVCHPRSFCRACHPTG